VLGSLEGVRTRNGAGSDEWSADFHSAIAQGLSSRKPIKENIVIRSSRLVSGEIQTVPCVPMANTFRVRRRADVLQFKLRCSFLNCLLQPDSAESSDSCRAASSSLRAFYFRIFHCLIHVCSALPVGTPHSCV